jgi:hypothetical protein
LIRAEPEGPLSPAISTYQRTNGTIGIQRGIMPKRVTTEDFIARSRAKHGSKFDYLRVEYTTGRDKVEIICPEHGSFLQRASHHMRGIGCPACGYEDGASKQSLGQKGYICKAREVHGDKFDYSKVVYKRQTDMITIICPEHGEFEQNAGSHIAGRGCLQCSRLAPLTTEDFIERSRDKHGDKFDYSKVVYERAFDKVTIICPVHGVFEQIARDHMRGRGCLQCSGLAPLTTADFIERAREIHGQRYDYSKAKYTTAKNKLTIICPEHGEFEQIAESHLNGKNCAKCMGRNKTMEEVITLAREVHGNKYDYSLVDSTMVDDKVTIICPAHGEFEQLLYNHLSGKGCLMCSGRAPITQQEFIRRAEQVHGKGTYDYSQAVVDGVDSNVIIICQGHGAFEQTPQNHIKQESGCPACAQYGFDTSAPTTLYYLRVDRFNQPPLYKIGVTNRTVAERFRHSEDSWRITVLSEQRYGTGSEALKEEKRIIMENRAHSYFGPDVLVGGGNTELFTKNILEETSETSR